MISVLCGEWGPCVKCFSCSLARFSAYRSGFSPLCSAGPDLGFSNSSIRDDELKSQAFRVVMLSTPKLRVMVYVSARGYFSLGHFQLGCLISIWSLSLQEPKRNAIHAQPRDFRVSYMLDKFRELNFGLFRPQFPHTNLISSCLRNVRVIGIPPVRPLENFAFFRHGYRRAAGFVIQLINLPKLGGPLIGCLSVFYPLFIG